MRRFAAASLLALSAVAVDCSSDVPPTFTVVDYAFIPDTLVVPVRTTVVWENTGAQYHEIAPDTGAGEEGAGSIPDLPLAPVNGVDRQSRTSVGYYYANERGLYHFRCYIHTWMRGVLIVR